MIEEYGKVTVFKKDEEEPLVTLTITAPVSEWRRVRDDLGRFPSRDEDGATVHVSFDFYRALQLVVDSL